MSFHWQLYWRNGHLQSQLWNRFLTLLVNFFDFRLVQKRILDSTFHLRGRGERREGWTILEMGVHHEGPDHRSNFWGHQGLVSGNSNHFSDCIRNLFASGMGKQRRKKMQSLNPPPPPTSTSALILLRKLTQALLLQKRYVQVTFLPEYWC